MRDEDISISRSGRAGYEMAHRYSDIDGVMATASSQTGPKIISKTQ